MSNERLLSRGSFLIAGALVLTACSWDENFERIDVERRRSQGFCVDYGDVITATLERDGSGAFTMSGTTAVNTDPESELCLGDSLERPEYCVEATPFESFTLSDEQGNELVELVVNLPDRDCNEEFGLECDHCLRTECEIDGHDCSPDCCGDLNGDFSTGIRQLLDYIDQIAP